MAVLTNTVSTTANTIDNLAKSFDELSKTIGSSCSNISGGHSYSNTTVTTTTGTGIGGYPFNTGGLITSDKCIVTIPTPSQIFVREDSTNMPDKSLDDYFKDLVDQYAPKHPEYNQSTTKTVKEKNKMNIFGQFGPITDGSVALSIKGMAVKSPAGKYVAYDANSEEMFDVDIMSIKTKSPIFFKMPVAILDVAMGDIIVHNDSHYCFVLDGDGKQFTVIDITTSEQRIILPQKSPFGFNFVTKVVSLINPNSANSETPFGNMLPFVMMNNDGDMKDMLPMLMMCGQLGDLSKNPMLMFMLMKDGKCDDSILPFLLMQSNALN